MVANRRFWFGCALGIVLAAVLAFLCIDWVTGHKPDFKRHPRNTSGPAMPVLSNTSTHMPAPTDGFWLLELKARADATGEDLSIGGHIRSLGFSRNCTGDSLSRPGSLYRYVHSQEDAVLARAVVCLPAAVQDVRPISQDLTPTPFFDPLQSGVTLSDPPAIGAAATSVITLHGTYTVEIGAAALWICNEHCEEDVAASSTAVIAIRRTAMPEIETLLPLPYLAGADYSRVTALAPVRPTR